MKNLWIVLAFFLLVLTPLGYKAYYLKKGDGDYIKTDSLEMLLNLTRDISDIDNQFNQLGGSLKEFMKDGCEKEKIDNIISNYNTKVDTLKKDQLRQVTELRQQLLDKQKELYSIISPPNIWLLILIIIICGIIGGYAGSRYNEIESNVKKKVLESLPAGDKTAMLKAFGEITTPEDPQKLLAYIIFGIIASSVSVLALRFFDSEILKFKYAIDYFIFGAFCLIGSVYAKDWILSLYNRINPRGNDTP